MESLLALFSDIPFSLEVAVHVIVSFPCHSENIHPSLPFELAVSIVFAATHIDGKQSTKTSAV
jgi:hypothetical protein